MSARRVDGPSAPCNHCGGPVPLNAPAAEEGEAGEPRTETADGRIVRCGFCGTALLIHVENGVRWTEEVARLERRTTGAERRLQAVARRRRQRAERRRNAPIHTATDWKGVRGGCGAAAFGAPFLAGGLIGIVFLGNGGPAWLLIHILGFGGFGAAAVAVGLRRAWLHRRVTVRADGARDSPPDPLA
ncbi:hypothetical protein [Alienimonas californiensis]|uniref:Uncharacterized protein n=1 Tax=Alienimonas californiensis TaxID=2527989 RepID=A0A517P6X4_9PLAN|nr:hypothetical protein [Alienimonas californiensis]QDT15114.1 hypothetical protein CA12_11950 [Alienimonas californiensis]